MAVAVQKYPWPWADGKLLDTLRLCAVSLTEYLYWTRAAWGPQSSSSRTNGTAAACMAYHRRYSAVPWTPSHDIQLPPPLSLLALCLVPRPFGSALLCFARSDALALN